MAQKVGLGLAGYQFKKFDSGREAFVSGVFEDAAKANAAVLRLGERGIARERINVVMSEELRKRLGEGGQQLEIEKGTKAAEGLGTGGAIGGTLGAVVGLVAAAGASLAIPGLGIVLAGPLAAALVGAGAGGATGGLLGLLVGAGMPEYRAKYYEERVKGGGVVLAIEAGSEAEADQVERELKDAGAEDIKQDEKRS